MLSVYLGPRLTISQGAKKIELLQLFCKGHHTSLGFQGVLESLGFTRLERGCKYRQLYLLVSATLVKTCGKALWGL